MAAYVADELGYFADENLDVEFVLYDDGPIAFQGMHGGDSQFTLLSQEPVLKAQEEGLKSKLIYTALDTRLYGFVAKPEIENVADLKGAAIFAGMPGSSPYSFVSAILRENGLDPQKDVTFVDMSYGASMAALSNDQIQASYINADNRVDIRGMDMEVNFLADTLVAEDREKYLKSEEFPGEIIVTTEKYATENPETVQSFVNAVSKATDWINSAESAEVAEILLPYYDGTSIETLTERVDVIKPALTKTGFISEAGQQAVIDFNIETGTIKEAIPYGDIVDMTFVEEYQNNK